MRKLSSIILLSTFMISSVSMANPGSIEQRVAALEHHSIGHNVYRAACSAAWLLGAAASGAKKVVVKAGQAAYDNAHITVSFGAVLGVAALDKASKRL